MSTVVHDRNHCKGTMLFSCI